VDDKSDMLRHFLAALAYRTQKALRGAPDDFADFAPGNGARTPRELVRHMASVLVYARSLFGEESYWPQALPAFQDEIDRFHGVLGAVADHLEAGALFVTYSPEHLLQGPLADAMAHAGQLAMLRRLHGVPIPPEDFLDARVDPANLGPDQPPPESPERVWPEAPPGWTPD